MILSRRHPPQRRGDSLGDLLRRQRVRQPLIQCPESYRMHDVPRVALVGSRGRRVTMLAHSPTGFGLRVPDRPEGPNEMFFRDQLRIRSADKSAANEVRELYGG